MLAVSQEIATGLLALLGAGIGAGATTWAAVRQQKADARQERARRDAEDERRRDEREAQRDAEREAAQQEARVAARILLADLLQATNRMRQAKDRYERYWSPRFALPTESWLEHRQVVARYMEPAGWNYVRLFYRSLGIVELQAAGAREDTEEKRPSLTEFQAKQIRIALRRSEPAGEALREFSGDETQQETLDEEDAPA